jgi:hypothetical protein
VKSPSLRTPRHHSCGRRWFAPLLCQIGNPNGEQENREHEREPEQETVGAARIVPKLLGLPRIRLTRWFVSHGDSSNWPLTWAESHKKSRERDKPRYRFLIKKRRVAVRIKSKPAVFLELVERHNLSLLSSVGSRSDTKSDTTSSLARGFARC